MIFSNSSSEKPINILKASLPYIPSTMQRTLSYFVKMEEFELMIRNFNNSFDETLSACSSGENGSEFNIQGLVCAIKPYLNDNEKELIDMFYNFMNAMNIYNIYRTMPDDLKSNFNFNSGADMNTNQQPEKKDYFFNTQPDTASPDFNVESQSGYDDSFTENEANSGNNRYFNNMNPDYDSNDEIYKEDTLTNSSDNSSDYNNNIFNNSTSNNMNFNNANKNTSSNNSNSNNFNIESLKALLNPSQRAMFDTYSSMLNMKQS